VNFAFDDDQEELRSTVRRFLEQHSAESDVRRQMAAAEGDDPKLWDLMSNQLGLQAIAIPEQYGGAGFTFVELGLVVEELGRALACTPFFSTAVLAGRLLLGLDDERAAPYLADIAAGAVRATVALTEETGSWSPGQVAMRAAEVAGGYRLTGVKPYVPDGATADLILVVACAGDSLGVFAVGASEPGLIRTPTPTLDMTRKQARLVFDSVPARRLGGDATTAIAAMLQQAAVALAAEQAGGAQRVLEMAVGYAGMREQFGRPIGSFQAIKHKCAQMLTEVESMKSAAYYGLWCVSSGSPELPVVASAAKVFCSEAYVHVTGENIQIHGGIGFTWDHPAHLYFKRAQSSKVLFGSPDHHRRILSGLYGISA
jgi:alkylation response protein AidB-like acyl-CoA dehydrogenase